METSWNSYGFPDESLLNWTHASLSMLHASAEKTKKACSEKSLQALMSVSVLSLFGFHGHFLGGFGGLIGLNGLGGFVANLGGFVANLGGFVDRGTLFGSHLVAGGSFNSLALFGGRRCFFLLLFTCGNSNNKKNAKNQTHPLFHTFAPLISLIVRLNFSAPMADGKNVLLFWGKSTGIFKAVIFFQRRPTPSTTCINAIFWGNIILGQPGRLA
jgi:hypothetical protein